MNIIPVNEHNQNGSLTPIDRMAFMSIDELELIVERGLATFIEVGLALYTIRENQLYKTHYTDFGTYLQERWGMGSSQGYRMIDAGYIASNLSPIGERIPTHESQVRPLTRLGNSKKPSPELWFSAWQAACEVAGDGLPTAKDVQFVVDEMLWSEPPPIPEGQYSVIYADPPWQYSNTGLEGSAASHYITMPTSDICDVQIPASDNAVLFLWATNPLLNDAMQVIESWGFNYKSNMVWVKPYRNYGKSGWYVMGHHELLLIATRGQFTPSYQPPSVLEHDRQEHSRKPLMYTTIEAMYPDQQYLELFARNQPPREGWTFWGNEQS